MLNNICNKTIALSIDVEEWFTVRNMREVFSQKDWDQQESRIHIGMDFILEELDKKNITATFFILGWVAERHPDLVKRIFDGGHEIAGHGYSHTPIDLLTPEAFEKDLQLSMDIISKITGKKVRGYRAPSFSVTQKTFWALDILKRNGVEYDSSIFSTLHPEYGINNFPRTITNLNGILEVPMCKGKFFGTRLPVCGGGYFRMLPYWLVKSSLEQTLSEAPVVMYFHPWEFDPHHPRMNLGHAKKFRHYVGLKSNRKKFTRLLNDFKFTTIENLIKHSKHSSAVANDL